MELNIPIGNNNNSGGGDGSSNPVAGNSGFQQSELIHPIVTQPKMSNPIPVTQEVKPEENSPIVIPPKAPDPIPVTQEVKLQENPPIVNSVKKEEPVTKELEKDIIQKNLKLDNSRHSIADSRAKSSVALDNSQENIAIPNKKQELNIRRSPSLLEEEGSVEIDLLRTNIYYTKKLYAEVSSLGKMLKVNFMFKSIWTLLIISITIFSFYAGFKFLDNMKSGNMFGGLMDSVSSSDLQGNLLNKLGTDDVSGIDLNNLSSGLKGLGELGDLDSINNLVSGFLN